MSRAATVAVVSSMRSASVDLPWSMWAMIAKLRMFEAGVSASRSTARGPPLSACRRCPERRRRWRRGAALLRRAVVVSFHGACCYVRFRRSSRCSATSVLGASERGLQGL